MKGAFAALALVAATWFVVNLIGALLVGALARWVLPGKDQMSWLKTILVGFLGGMVGKILAFMIGWRHLGMVRGFVVSVVGALALLVLYRVWKANKARTTPAASA
jgi:uncharacterized membrane protein YeaQ/YmgE (transglycosylase-associated protein family)